ncbi:uncharacterized protein G2W53_038255 [Senna tora]|uniref:Uncharacterized protein n=1 Tax=Senna tora TaxID=362788 RepID=A0A834SLG5_9FABA|nr:uncharacterized protein G2W53_038255 [Senna tora]
MAFWRIRKKKGVKKGRENEGGGGSHNQRDPGCLLRSGSSHVGNVEQC